MVDLILLCCRLFVSSKLSYWTPWIGSALSGQVYESRCIDLKDSNYGVAAPHYSKEETLDCPDMFAALVADEGNFVYMW